MKTRYGLVRHNNPDKLVTDINKAMEDGWILVGGVAVMQEPNVIDGRENGTRPVYAQAMVLRGVNGIEIQT